MSKFKVGDRVRVTNPADDFSDRPESCAGMTGEVTQILEQSCEVRLSRFVGKYREWGFQMSELSKVTACEPAPTTTLTRRDHFATAALTGLLAGGYPHSISPHSDPNADLARYAYQIASHMEAVLNKEGRE